MASPPLQSSTNPHFFQPLLPGSDTHLTIPVAFFSKHIEGKNEQKTAKLRSDASDKTWEVTIDGRRFTAGWNDFATAHDLRIGDIIIFRHEGDMVFNVTPFGPSCCEIQYAQSHIIKEEEKDNIDDDNENHYQNMRNVLRKKNLKPETEPKSSFSFDYCFVAQITASNLKLDTLDLVGDGDGETSLMICICPEEECSELMSKYMRENKKTKRRPTWIASSSSRENRFVTISLTRYNFRSSKLILPAAFMNINGIKKQNEIILMDKHGVKQVTKLVKDGSKYGKRGLGKGWKDFCKANDVLKIGQPFMLELIWELGRQCSCSQILF